MTAAALLATGGLVEAARRLVVPCAVLSALFVLLAFIVPRARRRTLLVLAGLAMMLSLVAFAVYLPNSA